MTHDAPDERRGPSLLGVLAVVANVVLAVVYPLAVWWSLTHLSPRVVGLVALAIVVPLMALRFRKADRENLLAVLRVPMLVLAVLLLGVVTDDARFVLFMPVLINGALLVTFAASLRGVPMIERFARMQDPDLTPAKQRHCRQITWVWVAFFFANASVAAALALFAPLAWWATYNGGIAYALMGSMFAGEYVLRKARFREYGRGPQDWLLSKLFPPRGPA
ncbi:MAG: hypothetical protein H6721_12575 [Sandaracinus sp.]|nr:hypothetical protein [Sandaracinus sp.]